MLRFQGRWFIRTATEIDDEIIVCWVGPAVREYQAAREAGAKQSVLKRLRRVALAAGAAVEKQLATRRRGTKGGVEKVGPHPIVAAAMAGITD